MREWYQINAAAGDRRAEVLIYEQIGKSWWDDSGVGAKDFLETIGKLDVDDIDLRINSLGGSVFEGNAIYNGLRAHKAKVHVKIDGIAASIASVIAMAGDDIEIPENGMIMIHDPWTYAEGNADEMRKAADMLDKIKGGLVAAYRTKTGKDDAEIADLMTAETWMTAREAVDMGFADSITGAVDAQNSFDNEVLARFRNVPASLKGSGGSGVNNRAKEVVAMGKEAETTKAPEITLELIKAQYPDIAKALKEEGVTAENQRIKDVRAKLVPGHEALIETMAFDGKSTGADAALAIVAAEQQIRANAAESFKREAPPVVPPVNNDTPEEVENKNAPIEDRAKLAWDKSPEVREEFRTFSAYLAFRKAEAAGQVKILGQK